MTDSASPDLETPPSLTSRPLRTGLAFPLTDAQRRVRDEAREFAVGAILPIADELDTSDEYSEELARLIRGSGLFRYFLPEDLGGAGLSVTNVCLIREELGRVSVRADEFYGAQGITIQPIIAWGTDEQRERCAAGMLDGTSLLAYCMTEPNAGSDVGALETVAREDGDTFVVTGRKRFIHAPHMCDTFLVLAKTSPELGKKGVSALLFERPADGISFSPYPLLLSSPTYEVAFDECVVPASSILGERNRGIRVALSNLDRLRPTAGASALGFASRALEAAIDYVAARRAFGGRLADLETIRHRIAMASAQLDAARLTVYAAAANADAGADGVDVAATSAKAKLLATETASSVIDAAVQLHGGAGLVRGSLTERLYRAVRASRIYEGTSEIMQLVIARSVMDREAK